MVVITQNIDELHETAGSTDIIELHGGRTAAVENLFNPFATGDAYMRQLFHCLQ